MSYWLFIDDERMPPSHWSGRGIPVRVAINPQDAMYFMRTYGCPDLISFDHDLGGDSTSREIVSWMIERDLDCAGNFIPDDFRFEVHSMNPIGAQWISGTLSSYLASRARVAS